MIQNDCDNDDEEAETITQYPRIDLLSCTIRMRLCRAGGSLI